MSDLPDNETPDVTLDFTDSLIGREFKGAYRVADKIGEGGFGSVYRALQMVVNREVAIKVLRPERARDERLRDLLTKRFKREAVAMSKLNHPNTVRLIDFGTSDDGMLFLVLELLRGRELEKVIRTEAPLAPARAARVAQQICKSLGEAHQQGIIHRDLKPANIFLCEVEGDPDFVKVMDFGIARLVDPDEGAGQITRTGMTQGTPAYMAPEQAMAKETTAASDLYAVGCMLYEMLTGCPVFTADSAVAVGLAHVRQEPPRISLPGLKPEVVEQWDALLQRLLVKSPAERPQTTQEVVDELKKLEKLGGEIDRPDAAAATVA
ncbi:MAG: serine/threonine-protein kinase, partial [Myxococcota bacterium]|nr:serine/threonine-protein kinase [Myxococcota bacterium]